MLSWNLIVTLALLLAITGLFWVLVWSQRAYRQDGAVPVGPSRPPRDGSRRAADRAPVGPEPPPEGLAPVAAAAVEAALRVTPRNSSEAAVAGALRDALDLAVRGQFGAEVRAVIEGLDGVLSWHDLRKLSADGPVIDHLVVGPSGVYVIASEVPSGRLSFGADEVWRSVGPDDRRPDPMVERMQAGVVAVAGLIRPVPVTGLVVLEDRLWLPAQCRDGGIHVAGIEVLTVEHLPARLTGSAPGADPLDAEAIWARLFPAFVPALDLPGHPFATVSAEREQSDAILQP